MKKLILYLLYCIPFVAFSQNYRIVSNVIPSFYIEDNENYTNVMTFAIDNSEIIGEDTIYYTFKTVRENVEGWGACVDSSAGSIMGKKLLQKSEVAILFNQYHDSIFISQNTDVGETWTFYKYTNGDILEARHTLTEEKDILGTIDSVKTFVLTRKNQEGDEVADELNGHWIELSKNFGFIRIIDCYLFPDQIVYYNLAGYENPEVGLQNLDARLVYDYEVGDEFHYFSEDLKWYYDVTDSVYKVYDGQERWTIRYVLLRTDYDDSVTYQYHECSKIFDYSNDHYDTLYYDTDTIETIIYDSILPGVLAAYTDQKIEMPSEGLYYEIKQIRTSEYNMRNQKGITQNAFMDYDSCVIRSIFDPCCYQEKYISGCGGPYYYWSDWFGSTIKNRLLYYNKNGETWGDPIAEDCEDLLSALHEYPIKEIDVQVYPVPFTDQLFIKNNSSYNISHINLYNINSKISYAVDLDAKSYHFKTSHLADGFYILEIRFENGYLIRRKVIKSNSER